MTNLKLKTGLLLFGFGFMGILSLLTVQFPLENLPEEVKQQFPGITLRLLLLVNPTLLLLLSVIIGVFLSEIVHLSAPTLNQILLKQRPSRIYRQLGTGIAGGIAAGIMILIIETIFSSFIPAELITLAGRLRLTVAARLLYGGITEEILTRFGLVTFIAWIGYKISGRLSPAIFLTAIICAALLFALGHFPIVFQAVPHPSPILLLYILLGNTAGGLLFGYLYWKQGLEASIIAHMTTHLVMIAAGSLFKIQ